MNYHPVTQKITSLLKENNIWFETFEHEEVRTSKEAAKVRDGFTLEQAAKALIVRVKSPSTSLRVNKIQFLMLVFPANLRFDNSKVKALLNIKDIRFATEEEVFSISPFGNLFALETIVDQKLFDNDKTVFNAGDRRFSVAMKSLDYKNLVNPKVAKIV